MVYLICLQAQSVVLLVLLWKTDVEWHTGDTYSTVMSAVILMYGVVSRFAGKPYVQAVSQLCTGVMCRGSEDHLSKARVK